MIHCIKEILVTLDVSNWKSEVKNGLVGLAIFCPSQSLVLQIFLVHDVHSLFMNPDNVANNTCY
jgi:hypothetical protein